MVHIPRKPLVVALAPLPQPKAPTIAASSTPALGEPIRLESGEYLLRSIQVSDVDERFRQWINDPQMLRGLNLASLDYTLDQLRQIVARFDNRHHYLIGIFERASGLLVGFYTVDVSTAHKTGLLTAGIGENSHEGKGTLWKTIDALLDDFFAHRDIDKISARILARNLRMIFNFRQNLRFVYEATLKQECLAPDGKRVDLLVFSAFRHASKANGTLPSHSPIESSKG